RGRCRAGGDEKGWTGQARPAGGQEATWALRKGYETNVGDGGGVLSGGIRQRIGLARAVYGNPSLVVLDEPSSNLDSDGDVALLACITDLKTRGVTVIIISHRPNTLGVVDKLLVLKEGAAELFGPRNEVIGHWPRLASVKPISGGTGAQAKVAS